MSERQYANSSVVVLEEKPVPHEENSKEHDSNGHHEVHFKDVVEMKDINLSPSISPSASDIDLKSRPITQKWSRKKLLANIFKSIIYCSVYGALGLCVASMSWGSTTIAKNTNSDSSQIGFLFTGKGLGYIFGALTFGKIYELLRETGKKKPFRETWYKLSGNYSFGLAALGIVIIMFCIPLIKYLWLIVLLFGIVGFLRGAISVGSNLMLNRIWLKKVSPWLQLNNLCYGIGQFISPLIAAPFLDKSAMEFNAAFWIMASVLAVVGVLAMVSRTPKSDEDIPQIKSAPITPSVSKDELHKKEEYTQRPTRAMTISAPHLDSYAHIAYPHIQREHSKSFPVSMSREQLVLKKEVPEIPHVEPEAKPKSWYSKFIPTPSIWMGTLIAVWTMFFVSGEWTFANLLFLMVTDQKQLVSKATAAVMTSIHSASLSATRVVLVIISAWVSPKIIVAGSNILCFVTNIVLLFFDMNIYVIWVCTVLMGIGIAGQFAAMISIPPIYMNMKVTGTMMSIIIVGSATGILVGPLIVTQLSVVLGNNTLIYVQLVIWGIAFVFFLIIFFVSTKKLHFWKRKNNDGGLKL